MKLFVGAFVILFAIQVQANVSAVREIGVDYRVYKKALENSPAIMVSKGRSALSSADEISKLDPDKVVEWESLEILQARFEELRDLRFLTLIKHPLFPRRISWMYPDDGCFARAAMLIKQAGSFGYETPNRVFIFGNLEAETSNTRSGFVQWWYHTAPVVKVAGQVYVLDPAIEPRFPLTIEEWTLKQVDSVELAELAYCHPHTYVPHTSCDNPGAAKDIQTKKDQDRFLNMEWNRQKQLGRDPKEVLGENPPWRDQEDVIH